MSQAWVIKILETPEEIALVEELQRRIWPGSETDIVPVHMLLASVHNGGLLIGAYAEERLVGFVFGFPAIYFTPDGPRLKHHSHMLGVDADFRNQGMGFGLKRAQWQMIRHQGVDRITWTYDPLLGINAKLNITKLGAVCNTYLENYYEELRDGLNTGLPSDRFQVDWWVNSRRVNRRLSRRVRRPLDLNHYLMAGAQVINSVQVNQEGLVIPSDTGMSNSSSLAGEHALSDIATADESDASDAMLLVEIPYNFSKLKFSSPSAAAEWRHHTRQIFSDLFAKGYLITDFIAQPGDPARSYYVLSYGESTL
jgi:predicted GNAT superfamily acetyltransferase